MENDVYVATINHALDHLFVVTKKIPFDEKDEGNDFFPQIAVGTILEVSAVICTDFGLDVRVHFSPDYEGFEMSIGYLATHCELQGKKEKFVCSPGLAHLLN